MIDGIIHGRLWLHCKPCPLAYAEAAAQWTAVASSQAMPFIVLAGYFMDGCRRITKNKYSLPCEQAPTSGYTFFYFMACNLTKVSLIKSFKGFAVAGFVSCHFMDCVMDCVKVECLCSFSKVSLSCCCTIFSLNSHFEIFLC